MSTKKAIPILSDFNTLALVLIPIGIAINYVGALIVNALQLPLFLDCIGTLTVAIIAGPWVGAVTGLMHNVVFALTVNPGDLPFGIVNLCFGLAAGFMARAGWFDRARTVFFAGLVIVAVALLTSVPIMVLMYGGATTGVAGVAMGYLIAIGTGIWQSVFAVSFFSEIADKLASAYVAFFIYRALPKGFLTRFPGYIRKAPKAAPKAAPEVTPASA
jgi:energy-coupling factor transport system substrate-specific component